MSNAWRKCVKCGKFISYKEMDDPNKATFSNVPETPFYSEFGYWQHVKCKNKKK